jgi:hypothetical protein
MPTADAGLLPTVRIPPLPALSVVRDGEPRVAFVFDCGVAEALTGAVRIAGRSVFAPIEAADFDSRFGNAGGLETSPASIEAKAGNFVCLEWNRQQRRNVSPQIEAPELPASSANVGLCAADVFDHQGNEPASRFDGLPLNPEARLEQRIVRGRQRLRALPRHRPIAVRLAGRRSDDQRRILELRAVDREHVLQDELRRVLVLAVGVALDIEADDFIAGLKQTFSPAS